MSLTNEVRNDKKRKQSTIMDNVIFELCRESEIKCDQPCMETIIPPHVRSTTEHYSKAFQASPYVVEIQLLLLISFMMCKAIVGMKKIKFKQD